MKLTLFVCAELRIGFQEVTYTVLESDVFATVTVEIFSGAVGIGENVSLDFFTTDDSALGKSSCVIGL